MQRVFYCPDTKEDNCIWRKPKQYFIREAEKMYGIDLHRSYVRGDHPHDAGMAYTVGASSVYLLTGHGKKHLQELTIKPTFIANDIFEGSFWIMR